MWSSISVKEAIFLLLNNQAIVAPTDTVYGLFTINNAPLMYRIKRRPKSKLFAKYVLATDFALDILRCTLNTEDFMGLTLLQNGIAYRFATGQLADIISQTGPLLGTSANYAENFPVSYSADLNLEVPSLEGGMCMLGLESTIVDIEKRIIVRSGARNIETLSPVFIHKSYTTFWRNTEEDIWYDSNKQNAFHFWRLVHSRKNKKTISEISIAEQSYMTQLLNSYVRNIQH